MAGIGFDQTRVSLLTAAKVNENTYEVTAQVECGRLEFSGSGFVLLNKPCNSALAAMRVIAKIQQTGDVVPFRREFIQIYTRYGNSFRQQSSKCCLYGQWSTLCRSNCGDSLPYFQSQGL